CRGWVESGPEELLDLAPANAAAAVAIPDLGRLAGDVNGFITAATRKAGADAVTRIRQGLTEQLGFDPLDPAALAKQGIDPERGALVFSEAGATEPLVALAARDHALVDTSLKTLIEKTDGASRFTESKMSGFTVLSAGRPFGTEVIPAFHWAHVGRYVLLAREDGKAMLEQALARLAQQSAQAPTLRTDPTYARLAGTVAPGDLMIFARATQPNAAAAGAPGGAITSVDLGAQGFSSDTFLDLGIKGLAEALAGDSALPLASKVGADASFVLLTRAARPEGVKALRSHPMVSASLDRVVKPFHDAAGVDPESEVLPLLAGPLTFSVHIADLKELPQRLKATRSPAALLDFFHVAVTAEVKDAKAFQALLDRSRERLSKEGIKLRQRTRAVGKDKATVTEPDRPDPKLGWTVVSGHYVYGAGSGRLDKVLDLLATGSSELPKNLNGSVAQTLGEKPGTTVALLRAGRVADAASPLATGGGTGLGALLGTAIELLRALGDVAVAVSAEGDGLRLRVLERMQ
ncbi:MAG: hypothetical protein HYZ27_11395, partial [Deltaproteobacteria bacterium]|nr:hypothetical protein [Deltaproteobacteria bacterium]